jgi:hypothetical protein
MNCVHFPPELSHRVETSVKEKRSCVFSGDVLHRLLADAGTATEVRLRALHEFADSCGARVETTPHLTIARFIPSNRGLVQRAQRPVIRNDSY